MSGSTNSPYFRASGTATGTDHVVFRYGTTIARFQPVPGHSGDICALLYYFSNRDLGTFLPNVPSIALQLLSTVINNPMALAATTAVLALFMPKDWIRRSQLPLRLAQQAIQQLHADLATCHESTAPDEMLLTVRFLYLFQVSSRPLPRFCRTGLILCAASFRTGDNANMLTPESTRRNASA